MAYAALISLHQRIEHLMFSDRIVLMYSSLEIIKFLQGEVSSTQQVVQKLKSGSNINRKRINVLDGRIREAAHELEDTIEFHVSDQLLSKSPDQEIQYYIFLNLEELKQVINSFTQTLNKMKDAYSHELCCSQPDDDDDEEDEDDDDDDDDDDENKKSSEIVGLSDQFKYMKNRLISGLCMVISLFGMAGIGKTTLTKRLFQDPSISIGFTKRAFVTVGPVYRLKRVLLDILKQVINPIDDDENDMLFFKGQESSLDCLRTMIYQSLKDQAFFLVLDDVWDKRLWSNLVDSFPMDRGRTYILITTRVGRVCKSTSHDTFHVRFLDKQESWDLLRKKVFCEQESSWSCPRELENAGKKIAERCEGLPLTIITVAEILSKSDEKTAEYWNEVAADKRHPVFVDAYDQMYKVLYPSYNYLNQELKACFLYMGVFPQTYEIPYSKLNDLWTVEGLCLENGSEVTLLDLDSSSLVMVRKRSFNIKIKTCSLYSPFWHLSNKEATRNKFFHGLNTRDDVLAEEDLKSQRRLCIRNNALFGIQDVYDSIASVPTVRSLLCTGSYHQYPVPIYFGLPLLRILDALTVRFYEFPVEVVNLVQLMYLSLAFNGNIPTSICKLWNLRYLIVHRHLSIVRSDGISPYLPVEIWDMEMLNHLQVKGSNLPRPRKTCVLRKLLTLLDVSPQSCTKYILKRIPNLEKLGIRIELGPDNAEQVPLSCFDHISRLHKLEELKCLIVNPRIVSEVVVPLSIFPSSLEKLTLSGSFRYPWEEMSKISSLPKLRELKLRCYAFHGPKWKVERGEFPKLRFLLIEDTDLVQWTFGDGHCFKKLESLSLKHCYKLQVIPTELGASPRLKTIELVDCNPMLVTCANKLVEDPIQSFLTYARKSKEERENNHFSLPSLDLSIHSSWDT